MIKNKFFRFFILISIIGFYFISRLQNLTSIPVFCDEGIYIRWSQIIKTEESLRFLPQTDGKQPLFMWLNAISLRFINDPLISGRIVSVFAGFGLLLGLFFLTAIILSFNSKEKNIWRFIGQSIKDNFYPALFTSLIYCLIPFSFFFDRLALADNLLSFFGITSLILSLLLAKHPRLDLSIILGFVLGLSWLTKSPAVYFIILSVATFLVFNLKKIKLYYLPVISSAIALLIYNILRLGPQFHMIALRNKDYIWTIGEILKHPLDPLKPHLSNSLELYVKYLSLPLIIFSIASLLLIIFKNKGALSRERWYEVPKGFELNTKYLVLMAWWLLPLIANCIFAKVFTARYVLFTLPPLLVIISILIFYFIKKIPSIYLKTIFIIAIFVPNLFFIYNISSNPFNQKLPSSEQGYITDWTSGWGIKEIAIYLKERSLSANVIVGTEGYFGTLPDGLQIYTTNTKQLTVFGVGLDLYQIPPKLIDAKNHGDEVYLLMNKSRLKLTIEELSKIELINSIAKPNGDYLLLYKI